MTSLLPLLAFDAMGVLFRLRHHSGPGYDNEEWGRLLTFIHRTNPSIADVENLGLAILEMEPGVIDRLRSEANDVHGLLTPDAGRPPWFIIANLRFAREEVSDVTAKLIERADRRRIEKAVR